MSDYSQEHDTFQQEASRTQKIETAISRTLEACPVKHIEFETTETGVTARAWAVRTVIQKLKDDGVTFEIGDRNWVKPMKNGRSINLGEAVQDCLLLDPKLGDQASICEAVSKGLIGVACKADLKDVSAKVAYVKRFGEEAFAKLPLRRVATNWTPDTITAAQYKTLPVSEKIKFTEKQISNALRRR